MPRCKTIEKLSKEHARKTLNTQIARIEWLGAIIATAIFAAFITATSDGSARNYHLIYFLPASIPVWAFAIDRHFRCHFLSRPTILLDITVSSISLSRAFYPLPYISGHAFFLSYCLLTTRRTFCRITASLVLGQTVYYKIVVWNYDSTLYGGVAAGICCALLWQREYRSAAT